MERGDLACLPQAAAAFTTETARNCKQPRPKSLKL
jgi:hypothetical protein